MAEHTKVHVVLEVEEKRREKAEKTLALARQSCEGLSEEQLSVLESVRLDATHFFSK